jgi:ABC-type polysaccharide/polyol phosphate export permease
MKDQGTFLGFFWTLMHPLIYFLVLFELFNKWMGTKIPHFAVYLIIGIVQWNFFAAGTTGAVTTIISHGSYIKNMNFPKAIFVFASTLSVLFSHLLELVILLVFCYIVGGYLPVTSLGLLVLLALNIYLVVAVSFVLATVGVFFLDIARIWGILMNIGLFLTPIFYTLELLSPDKQMLIRLNPMTHIITASRDLLIEGRVPAAGGLLYVFLLSSFILFAGYRYFRANEGHFVERI